MEHQAEGGTSSRCFRLAYLVFLLTWFVLALLLLRLLVLEVWEDSSGHGELGAGELRLQPLPDMAYVGRWGQDGVGVRLELEKLHPIHRAEYKEGYQKHRFNTYLSDRISMRRTLRDVRDPECQEVKATMTPDPLTASVIIVFRDDPWTVLLRTVYSVVDRSPEELVREIILVDDGSTEEFLQHPRLEHYLAVLKKVRILRLSRPHGQATARMMAARQATGDVLVFLQPRCECTDGWLFPLLNQISHDRNVTAVPLVDTVDFHTFQYVPQKVKEMKIGSFTWELKVSWRVLTFPPPSALLSQSVTVMADGIFAIHRHYFFTVGGYDELLIAPQNQNLELSFRLSMCGGGLELVPCSHVGLVRPMDNPVTDEKQEGWDLDDRVRITEVWLDRYKDFFYERLTKYPDRLAEILSTSQIDRRENLTCRSFTWYLRKLEPNMLLSQNIVRRGSLYHSVVNKTVLALAAHGKELVIQEWYLKPSTIWYLTDKRQLLTEGNLCLSVHHPQVKQGHRSRSDQPSYPKTRLEMTFQDLKHHHSKLDIPLEEIPESEELSEKELAWQNAYDQYIDIPQTLEEPDIQEQAGGKDQWPAAGSQEERNLEYKNYEIQLNWPKSLRFEKEKHAGHGRSVLATLEKSAKGEERPRGKRNIGDDKSQVVKSGVVSNVIVLQMCPQDSAGQRWDYTESGALRHRLSDLCLEAQLIASDKYSLRMARCNQANPAQMWTFSNWLDYWKKLQDKV